MKYSGLIIFLSIFVLSCQKNADITGYTGSLSENEMYDAAPLKSRSEAPPMTMQDVNQPTFNKKKIIKDGSIFISVTDLETTRHRIDSLVKLVGGYFANESYYNSSSEITVSLSVRLPSAEFEKMIVLLESGDDEITNKSIGARDVTDEFIDIEARLENKRKYVKRYDELLKKADSVSEMTEIIEKKRILEEEIESAVGRLKYLTDQVDYSTLNITLTKKIAFKFKSQERDLFGERLKSALSKGWFGFVDFCLFLVKIWPAVILIPLIIYFWRRKKQKPKKKK